MLEHCGNRFIRVLRFQRQNQIQQIEYFFFMLQQNGTFASDYLNSFTRNKVIKTTKIQIYLGGNQQIPHDRLRDFIFAIQIFSDAFVQLFQQIREKFCKTKRRISPTITSAYSTCVQVPVPVQYSISICSSTFVRVREPVQHMCTSAFVQVREPVHNSTVQCMWCNKNKCST